MNKYELMGRLAEAEEKLAIARKKRAMTAEQIYQKSPDLMLRHKDVPEQENFDNAISTIEILLEQYKQAHQEVGEQLSLIDELNKFS